MTTHISIFDTTLRDGEQSPGCSMTSSEKLRLASKLEALGVDVIEAGFAIASEDDSHAISTIAAALEHPVIASLARANKKDIDAAARALEKAKRPRIHIVLAASDLHLEAKLKMTRNEALDLAVASVRHARSYVDEVQYSLEDATRSDSRYLCEVIGAVIEAGASIVNLPDTVGYAFPLEYRTLFEFVREHVPTIDNVVLSCHCHNDLGMAVANSLAAIQGGALQVECTINGIGERAGNASLEEIAAAMFVRQDYLASHTSGIALNELYSASELLSEIIRVTPAPNKAVVGANAFAHESGIHQHGMLANPLCYEILNPERVGAPTSRIVLGKHSGRHGLMHRLVELGYTVPEAQVERVYGDFISIADKRKSVRDPDLIALAHKAGLSHELALGR